MDKITTHLSPDANCSEIIQQYSVKALPELQSVAQDVLKKIRKNATTFLLLEGQMGSGKTTFVSAIARELKVTRTVNSPTFNLLHKYSDTLYHYDLFRIGPDEAEEAGFFELWENRSNHFVLHVLEWPDKVPAIYEMDHTFLIRFEYSLDEPEQHRKMTLYRCLN